MVQFAVRNHRGYHRVDENLIIASTPKAGTTSINRALKGLPRPMKQRVFKLSQADPAIEVALFVRHPIERLVSAWYMICHQNRGSFPNTFEGFIERALSKVRQNMDEHWIPQSDYHSYQGKFLPTQLYRFEDINRAWPALVTERGRELGWHNKASGRPDWRELVYDLPVETQARVQRYYADDLKLYEDAHKWCPVL